MSRAAWESPTLERVTEAEAAARADRAMDEAAEHAAAGELGLAVEKSRHALVWWKAVELLRSGGRL